MFTAVRGSCRLSIFRTPGRGGKIKKAVPSNELRGSLVAREDRNTDTLESLTPIEMLVPVCFVALFTWKHRFHARGRVVPSKDVRNPDAAAAAAASAASAVSGASAISSASASRVLG